MKIKDIIKNVFPGSNMDKKIYKLYKKANYYYLRNNKILCRYYEYKIYKKYHCCISAKASIGKNITIPHPIGIVIGEGAKIGDNVVIYQNVTIGRKNRETPDYPSIGNNVIIYSNSIILGNVRIGDNTTIGCNTIVLKSIENNGKVHRNCQIE